MPYNAVQIHYNPDVNCTFFRDWRVDDTSANNSSAIVILNNKKIVGCSRFQEYFVHDLFSSIVREESLSEVIFMLVHPFRSDNLTKVNWVIIRLFF